MVWVRSDVGHGPGIQEPTSMPFERGDHALVLHAGEHHVGFESKPALTANQPLQESGKRFP